MTKLNVSNPKVWVVIGVGFAGILILAEVNRRRLKARNSIKQDFGAFIERIELLPFPQPPPPAARLSLSGLSFAIKDNIDVKEYVTGFGSPAWKRMHEAATKTAMVVTALLKNGSTCVGKTIMDEFGLGITGENVHYGTPTNPKLPSHIPGGSSSGSAVAVAAELVDFALGTDTTGCIRVPVAFCGVFGFRPSHGAVSTIGVLPVSQSLDSIGWLARDPSVLHRVGHVLLQIPSIEPKRTRCFVIADDLFQLCNVPKQKTVYVVTKVIEKLSGYQTPKHLNLGQYIASNVPSLKGFIEQSTIQQNGMSTLRALSSVMFLLQRYEFNTNYEEWMKSVKPRLGSQVTNHIAAAVTLAPENIKVLYKVRTEMRVAMQNLLKNDGILVLPTIADPPLKLKSRKGLSAEVHDRAFALLGIASMSGCCQAAIPFGEHDNYPISLSFIASHGTDKFLLDTVLDMYSSIQDEVIIQSSASPLPDTNGSIDASELLKEKGNAAFKGKQWNKAVSYYTEAIKLNDNATYYSNRAAAYLELGCFQQAEEDCTKAISLDKKNVKAYMRRGTARESLLFYKEALQGKNIRQNVY
ncbi:outer envelope protein 64, mitochondrial isoform X2 [Solanum tuberosum]|uniref:outer envelope protein 64, mitochondrial isoform X2 n=1 Tax=Solanum tuberosum TaxID=4113 RepID=UPI000739FF6F|nr:PREDICTED: outer envelope protein 64, mitochondrial isoform X2 [Solanum tuberosum]